MPVKLLALLLAAASSAGAADISGVWSAQIKNRNGEPQDVSFRLFQRGDSLTGKMYGDNESLPISEGKISGNEITFVVSTELNGQINKLTFTGALDGKHIRLTRERAGQPKSKQELTLNLVVRDTAAAQENK